MNRLTLGVALLALFVCTVRLAAPVMATSEEIGVVVSNDTDTNIAVFGYGSGVQGCTVAPGGTCFVPAPPFAEFLTIKVVRCGKDGDLEDSDNLVTFRMDATKRYRVKRRQF